LRIIIKLNLIYHLFKHPEIKRTGCKMRMYSQSNFQGENKMKCTLELIEAENEINLGNFTTQEELKKQMKEW